MSESTSPRRNGDSAKATTGGKRAENRRKGIRAIVDAARRLSSEGGLEAVRLRDVARLAGVSMGALYRCFDSKEDILLYAFAEDFTLLEQRVDTNPPRGADAGERVEAFFRIATRGIVQKPKYGRALIAATASGHPSAVRHMATLHARMGHLIERAVVGDGHESFAGVEAELEIAAQALNRVWFSALVAWAGGLQTIDDALHDVRRTAELLLAGVASRRAG